MTLKYVFNIEDIKRYIKEKYTVKQIAKFYGCSCLTIQRFLKKHGLHCRGHKPGRNPLHDLSGLTFGKLKVLNLVERENNLGTVYWLCECQCENRTLKEVKAKYLLNGSVVSCGCYNKEKSITHGMTNTRIYNIYRGMKDRCYNENRSEYKYYGGKGIVICEEWLNKETGFFNFYNWAFNNGYTDELTIDRIDSNKDYSPDNCEWITQTEQMKKLERTKKLTYNNTTKTIPEWSKIIGMSEDAIRHRLTIFSVETEMEKILSPIHFNKWSIKKC